MNPEKNTFNETGEAASSESAAQEPDTVAAPGAFPKTGENVPAAGMLAVILLAGAIICATGSVITSNIFMRSSALPHLTGRADFV